MSLIDILVLAVLFFSFIGGVKEGAVKELFSLLVLVIAIPLAGAFFPPVADYLTFLPGGDLENFIGFFITLALITLVLHLISWLPRGLAQRFWNGGILFRLVGGTANLFGAAIGIVLFTLLIGAYPIIGWLQRVLLSSEVIAWLANHLNFIAAMLPDIWRISADFTVMRW